MNAVKKFLAKAKPVLDKLRAAEPAWLASRRKSIVGWVSPLVIGAVAHKLGRDLTWIEVAVIDAGVTGALVYLIPNKQASAAPVA